MRYWRTALLQVDLLKDNLETILSASIIGAFLLLPLLSLCVWLDVLSDIHAASYM